MSIHAEFLILRWDIPLKAERAMRGILVLEVHAIISRAIRDGGFEPTGRGFACPGFPARNELDRG